jgi:spore coat protein U-like protein
MTPLKSLFVAMIAAVMLVAARSGAEAQFPHGLLAGPAEKKGYCAIETRPLNFGNYDPESNANVDVVTEVIYTCDNQAKKIRIEMEAGVNNTFDRRAMYGGAAERLYYNVYLDPTHTTIWGQGALGTDVYYENNPPNGTPVVVRAYGRIFPRQDVPTGNYADALIVRVLF